MPYQKHKRIILTLLLAAVVGGGVLGVFISCSYAYTNSYIQSAGQLTDKRIRLTGNENIEYQVWRFGNPPEYYLVNPAGQDADTAMLADENGNLVDPNTGKSQSQATAGTRTETSGAQSALSDVIARMLAWILYGLTYGLGWILILVTKAMLAVSTFNNFTNHTVTTVGWKIIRDVCNNFFIILLLVSAVGTILHQKNYDFRTMMPKILLAAVLINFSKMFFGLMIDASQILMLTFAAPLAQSTGYNVILNALGLPDLMSLSGVAAQLEAVGFSTWNLVAAMLFAVIFTFIALVVIVCITAVLMYRVVYMMFLVVLSPLYFFGWAFPAAGKHTNQILSDLVKYLIIGPAMMFFIYISLITLKDLGNGEQFDSTISYDLQTTGTGGSAELQKEAAVATGLSTENSTILALSKMGTVEKIINFGLLIGLLVCSLVIGQKLGTAGGSWAGKGMGFLTKQGKRFSGFNLAKRTAKEAPRAISTAVDDRLGIRQRLYSGLYQVGGKNIPFAREALGGKIESLEAGTTKRFNQRIRAVAQGAKIDKKDENQLRDLASGGAKYEKIAAIQALMKKGLIRDDEINESKKRNNIDLVNQARLALEGTELGKEFDENLRKYNPNLAMNTMYTRAGKINREKLESDLKTGKVDLNKIMGSMDPATLTNLNEALGGKKNDAGQFDDTLAKFLMKHGAGDLSKLDKAMSSEVKKSIWSGVSHTSFIKKDAQGNNIIDAAGRAAYDEDLRKEYLSTKYDVAKAYDRSDPEQKEKARKYFSENRNKVLENMHSDGMTADFMRDFGDLVSPKELQEKFGDRSKEHSGKMEAALREAIVGNGGNISPYDFGQLNGNLAEARKGLSVATGASRSAAQQAVDQAAKNLKDAEEMIKKYLLSQGSFEGITGQVNAENKSNIVGSLKAEEAEKIKWGSLSDADQRAVAQGMDANTLWVIGARGNNNELIKGVKQRIFDEVENDPVKKGYDDLIERAKKLRSEDEQIESDLKSLQAKGDPTLQNDINALMLRRVELRGDQARGIEGERKKINDAIEKFLKENERFFVDINEDRPKFKPTDWDKKARAIKGKKKGGDFEEQA
ncbi:MAG: MFS transporter [Candidatus Buchananbacteria bacterium]